jgi:tetratricopeptide (TPR) repeat protein
MLRITYLAILVHWLNALVGCSHDIEMVSIPSGAVVYEVTESGKRAKVGVTPLRIKDKVDIERRNFLFEAAGFIPQNLRIIFPYEANAKIVIYLSPLDDNWFKNVLEAEYPEKVDDISVDLLEFQNKLLVTQPESAEPLIQSYITKYPKFSIVPTLVGVFYYKHENYESASRYLKSALKLNNENIIARRLLQFMER